MIRFHIFLLLVQEFVEVDFVLIFNLYQRLLRYSSPACSM